MSGTAVVQPKLPPRVDTQKPGLKVCFILANPYFVPEAVNRFSPKQAFTALLDHSIRAIENRIGEPDAERLGGFAVDEQLQFCGLFDRQIAARL